MPASRTALLWDIDGTLLTAGWSVAGTFLDAVRAVCGSRPDPAGLDFGGRLDPDIATMLVTAVGADLGLVDDVLVEFEASVAVAQERLAEHVVALPGAAEVVARAAAAGAAQTVVTGNLESVGRFKLDAAGLVPPVDPALGGFGASAADRPGVARVAVDRLVAAGWTGTAADCWIVGDTPRDADCARALGLRCVLVATGRRSVADLSGLGADLVLPDLTDPTLLPPSWFG